MRKLGIIASYWVKLRCVWITGKYCLCFLVATLVKRGQIGVADVDRRLFNWATDVVDTIAPQIIVESPREIALDSDQRYIIMANHTSLFDIPLAFLALPDASIRMLAKKELARIPIFGRAMKRALFPFIDRKNRNRAIEDLQHAKALMERHHITLWIAPEGRRSVNGELQPFKKGAFITAIQAQATLLPLAIKGAYQILPYRSKHITIGQPVTMILGEPLDCRHQGTDDKDALRELAFQRMQQLLDI